MILDQTLFLQFFDQSVIIESDSASFLSVMAAMYRHFQAPPAVTPISPVLRAIYRAGDAGGRASLALDNNQEWLEPNEAGEGSAYERILYTMASRAQSYFLVHAGAVAYHDRGVILAADAANGKTTLVLELLRRGWNFLSDEMAALSLIDGRLHAFPRALRLREDTLARVGLAPRASQTLRWLDKIVVDVDDLMPGQRTPSATIARVLILSDTDPVQARDDRLAIRVDCSTPAFLDQLQQLPGVLSVELADAARYPLIQLETQRRMQTLTAIEDICWATGIQLVDVIKRPEVSATFSGPARLEPLTHSQAALELLRRFEGGHHSSLLENTFSGQTTRLYQAVARLIAGAECHRLIVGDRPLMADLVDGLERTHAG